jgi:hypothetical protein
MVCSVTQYTDLTVKILYSFTKHINVSFHFHHNRITAFTALPKTQKSTAALSVHLLYHISTKMDNICGKYGHQFIYSPK